MSKEFKMLFAAVCAVAQGTETVFCPDLPEGMDWKLWMTLLREQSVPALAARALALSPLAMPEAFRSWAKHQYLFLSAKEGYRRSETLRLLTRLRAAGFSPAVLKGFAVGAFYAAPDCRISGDIDILIPIAEETRLCEFLVREEGCRIVPRALGNHSIAQHPVLGTIEVHVSLFASDTSEQWFGGLAAEPQHPFVYVETAEGGFWGLDPRDNMHFLLLHAIKHFIGGGLNLRNIVDCAVFFIKNQTGLDIPALRETLQSLRFDTLCDAFLYACMEIGGLALPLATETRLRQEAPRLAPLAETLLADLEEHMFLREDEDFSRGRTGIEFAKRRMGKAAYAKTAARKRVKIGLRRVFPTRLQLTNEYPVLRRLPALLPFVWAIRSVKKLFWHEKDENTNAAQTHRLELFAAMGMFPE